LKIKKINTNKRNSKGDGQSMKVKVNILDKKIIPTLGKGPFRNIEITEELARSLGRLNFHVEYIKPDDRRISFRSAPTEEVAEVVAVEPEQEETEVESEEVVEDNDEESEDDVVIEEAQSDEEDVESEEEETEVESEEVVEEDEATEEEDEEIVLEDKEVTFLKSAKKEEIRTFLKDKGVQFKYSDNVSQLLAYVGL